MASFDLSAFSSTGRGGMRCMLEACGATSDLGLDLSSSDLGPPVVQYRDRVLI